MVENERGLVVARDFECGGFEKRHAEPPKAFRGIACVRPRIARPIVSIVLDRVEQRESRALREFARALRRLR
jgi:hypothetical protein